MRKGFKWLLGIALALVLFLSPVAGLLGFGGLALANTTQTVTINVTPQWISISNTPNTYGFGTVATSSTPNTTITGFNVTNNGSVTVNIAISTNGWSPNWTYGSPASETANLTAGITSFNIAMTAIDTGYSLKTNLAAAGSQAWGLQLNAPTAFTEGNLQNTTITLTATAA